MPATDLYELAEEALEQIEGAGCPMRENGADEWRGRCPLRDHDDLTLRVDEERERLWLGCSHVSCDWRAIHQALGSTQADLRLDRGQAKQRDSRLRNPDLREVRRVRWAWCQRVPIGKPSLNVGNEGVGKGLVTAYLAAGWSRGELDGDLHGSAANVLIVGNEDALADTWTPRLHVAKADFEHIFFQRTGDFELDFTEPGDIEHLRGWVRRYSIAVAIFDALLDHLGDNAVDEYKPKAIRLALRPLRNLVDEEQIAAVGNMHPRKGRVLSFRDLVASSHQFNAVSRSSLLLAKHPDDERRRVLAWGKGNHAGLVPTLEFRVEQASFKANGEVIDSVRAVDWTESEVTLEDAIDSSSGGPRREPGRPADQGKWAAVAQALTDVPQSATTIAATAGAGRTLTYELLGDFEVDGIAAKQGRGAWVRGPRWGAENGAGGASGNSSGNSSGNYGDGVSGRTAEANNPAQPSQKTPPEGGVDQSSGNSAHGVSGRTGNGDAARAHTHAREGQPEFEASGNGPGDPDFDRRARAEAAIRRAQERGA